MKHIFLITFLFSLFEIQAQEAGRFFLTNSQQDKLNAVVCIPLDGINYNTDKGKLVLFEKSKTGEKPVPCQLEPGYTANLWFIAEGKLAKGEKREYIIRADSTYKETISGVLLKKDSKDINLSKDGKSILNYRYATMYPPDGINPLYKRSGFIHPVWSPQGEVLIRIQAPDHYHHYGIWGPWTKTYIGIREVDFWNLASGQGTVKFAGFLSETQGKIFSGFKALQQHIDFGAPGEDQVAMNEILDVRAWNTDPKNKVWIVDYTSSLSCPLTGGILLDAYRYGGGIGFRATGKWNNQNSSVLTSDNKTRADADGSFAKWCIVEGESDTPEGRSGILFMSHPSNCMHSEPMRVWPSDMNGRGDLYFEFVLIRHRDWKLEQNENYTLKYRMIIFDGKMDATTAEMYWNGFASMPKIDLYMNGK